MIKKLHLLTVAGIVSATTMSAQAPQIEWATSLDGIGMEMPLSVKACNDGNVLFMNKFMTSAKESTAAKPTSLTTDYWYFNMTDGTKTSGKLSTGTPDVKMANGTDNMVLYKTDTNGQLIWTVSTNVGDFSKGGIMTATPDNGAMVLLKMKHTSNTEYKSDVLCQFVDNNGVETPIKWEAPDYTTFGQVFQPVLAKISATGEIEWARRIEAGYDIIEDVNGKIKKRTDGFDVKDMVADNEGNVYITGTVRYSLNFGEKANLTSSKGFANWTGSTTYGDLFVVKLDASGNAVWGTVSTGDAIAQESPSNITLNENHLYISGYMKGDGKSTVKLGESSLVPTDFNNLFAASLDTENGTFNWGKVYNTAANDAVAKPRNKPMALTVNGDNLYLGGSHQGDILDGDKVVLNVNEAKLNAFLLNCDANNGDAKSAVAIAPGIGEVQAIHVRDNKVLATGYVMSPISVNLYTLDSNLSAESLQTETIMESPMGTSVGSVIVNDILISSSRYKNEATLTGLDWKATAVDSGKNSWACLFCGHSLKGEATGIESVDSENGTQVIYDLSGRRVAKATKGLYIINGKKVMVR